VSEVKGVVEPQFEGELVVGRFYMVPTVYGPLVSRMGIWPVLGPKHEDSEIIDFKWEHYHYDWRFFSQKDYEYICRQLGRDTPFGYVMSERPDITRAPVEIRELRPVIYRRRKCQRLMPEFPRSLAFAKKAAWLPKLEAAYRDQRLKPGLICPHRGASLRGLPVTDNCVVCPLHGLRWNIETGKLVPEGGKG
jgi:hypothetical protein